MEVPAIRYAHTEDGVSIAYAIVGEGPTMIHSHGPFAPLAGWLEAGEIYEERITGFSHVRFDPRGVGMSDRDVATVSLDDQVHDIEAVIDAVSPTEVELLGLSFGAHATIAYTVRHPERVSHLILYGTYDRGDAQMEGDVSLAMTLSAIGLGQRDDLALRMLTMMVMADASKEDIELHANLLRDHVSVQYFQAALESFQRSDVSALLPQVRVPTLVAHRRDDRINHVSAGQVVAAAIPNSRFLMLPPGNHLLRPGEPGATQFDAAVADFLGAEPPRVVQTVAAATVQTILFTDLESSTALTQHVGDEAAQDVLRGHNTAVRGALEANGGREVKHTGDGIMASFPSAVAAVTAALQMQREMAGGEVRVRVGINAGEPIAEDDDLFGTAVQLAARITDRAEPGQVLVSNVVRELCAGKTFEFTSLGESTLKGFDEPVTLYAVRAD